MTTNYKPDDGCEAVRTLRREAFQKLRNEDGLDHWYKMRPRPKCADKAGQILAGKWDMIEHPERAKPRTDQGIAAMAQYRAGLAALEVIEQP